MQFVIFVLIIPAVTFFFIELGNYDHAVIMYMWTNKSIPSNTESNTEDSIANHLKLDGMIISLC